MCEYEMNKIVERIHSDRQMLKAVMVECERDGKPLTVQALNEWRKLKNGVPAQRAVAVSRATGLKLHTIRPDIFPRGM